MTWLKWEGPTKPFFITFIVHNSNNVKIEITFNGKAYDSIDEPHIANFLYMVKEITSQRLITIAKKIRKEGAVITIQAIGENLGYEKFDIKNASPELIEEIRAILDQ